MARQDTELKAPEQDFPLKEAREIVKGLARPKPLIYWADFLFSAGLGWAAFIYAVIAPSFSAGQFTAIFIATFALYRAVIFIHELAHLKRGTFKFFRLAWNILCGFPMLVPAYTYSGVHTDHHLRKIYGTHEDGEYVPFATGSGLKLIGYVLLSFFLPLLFVGRFLILTPISYLLPPLRRWLWARASSLTIDMSYERPPPAKRDDKSWAWQEAATMLTAIGFTILFINGILPLAALAIWYVVTVLVFLFNSLRTLCAHAYRNPGDQPMSTAEEFLDSVNVPGNPLWTPLWAPVGLRYHATHHLFPSLPYHALGAAHRKLVAELPDNRLYLKASRNSMFDALKRIWAEAEAAKKNRRTPISPGPSSLSPSDPSSSTPV
ncbi:MULTISPECIES: fatty acid desaturase [unclassified Iodidimonas]|jgi:fatty acid desaturase|uniref:fatty acid desaturase family protein n=1 Tax=unclassified Iodidimonas TaxID=2626145 RepID=UPI0024822356|nr:MULTISPECIES: fatty acid desaturase [unclassified Iodidimonas]